MVVPLFSQGYDLRALQILNCCIQMFNTCIALSTYSSCTYIDVNGGSHEVELEDFEASKADPLCKQ